MKRVNISELKANLSAYLRLVGSGEEVLVCNRNRAVARIVPVVHTDFESMTRTERLIAKGVLRAPTRPTGEPRYIPNPAPGRPISREVMDALWEEERADRV